MPAVVRKAQIQKEIERTIRAMLKCGLEVAGVEKTGPETFRVLTKGGTPTDAYGQWKAKRDKAKANAN